MSKCKGCGEEIDWRKQPDGKTLPFNPTTGLKHICQSGPYKPLKQAPKQEIVATSPALQKPIQPEQVIGMVDPAKVLKVTIGCTINLHDYNNLKLEVEATDAVTARKALIEILGITIPAESPVSRECIDRYVKAVLAEKPAGGA